MKRALMLSCGLCLAACGNDSPVGPTNSTGQQVVNVSGVWNYTATLQNVAGGECFAGQTTTGTIERGSLSITQNGATLTATSRDSSSGASCTYTGTAGSSSFSLGWSSCDAAVLLGVRCPSGLLRDLRLVTLAINGSASSTMLNGTRAQTFNITTAGTSTGVGTWTLNGTFIATK